MFLTEVFNGVISLLAVHSHCVCIGAAHSVANDVTADQDGGAEGRGPGHYDAVRKGPDMERAWLVRHLTLCKKHIVTADRQLWQSCLSPPHATGFKPAAALVNRCKTLLVVY